jgi:hypothetical protein
MSSQKNAASLEDLFELPEDYLQGPQARALRPALIEATERSTGQDKVLKYWLKTATPADDDLRELWRHEKRQVDRVMSYPGADEVMVGVVDMIETTDAFCVVHEPGTMTLHAKLRTAPARYWLRSLGVPLNRVVLWENLARLVRAVAILHAHGLVHGRLDPFSIFTSGSNSPDFRLGGFEWSLVLGEPRPAQPSLQQIRERIDRLIYSYAEDWKAVGCMFAELAGVAPDRLRENDPYKAGASFELSYGEIEFLRRLVDPMRDEVLEAKEILRSIEVLLRELSGHPENRTGRHVLLFRPNAKMQDAIYRMSDGEIAITSFDRQAAFVAADIAGGAKLVPIETGGDIDKMFLLTEMASYQLVPFSEDGVRNWQIAVVNSVMPRAEAHLPNRRDVFPLRHPIELAANKQRANALLSRLAADALEWTLPVAPEVTRVENPETKTVRQAMLLVQAVDAVLKGLQVLPVRISATRVKDQRIYVHLGVREDKRDAIAASLGEKTTLQVMERLFDEDDLGVDVEWRLSTSGGLSSRGSSDTPVRFQTVVRDESGQPAFEFQAFGLLPSEEATLFLRRKGDHGTEHLIKRRLRLSRALSSQSDLVSMFIDPRRKLRSSGEILALDSFYKELDEPKQDALERLWTTTPTYFVVGPPGVGKTRLISEVVRRKLANDTATRILLSSQSHQALDHVLRSVRKVLKGNGDAILVRSPGREGAISTDDDVKKTALSYLAKVRSSALLKEAPRSFSVALEELNHACEAEDDFTESARETEGSRALNALVLESANLVFSTSTSSDIEQLSDDDAQFDWVILDEAAKASGPDLLGPLSLSGRRLFIGDHHQLPPFDAERVAAIVADGDKTKRAVEQASAELASTFFDSGLEELNRDISEPEALQRISTIALRSLEPFRALVEEDQSRPREVGGIRRAVSSELLVQHRMDPALAELISICFYKNRLSTGEQRAKDSKNKLLFDFGPSFPDSPIVFVDMPFAARTGKANAPEVGRPRWHNPAEVKTIVRLLRSLRVKGVKKDGAAPTVAVLTPYRAQVERLTKEVDALRSMNNSELSKFGGFTHDNRMCGTVDSAQGSEADLVIVSLVRNNHRTGTPALGFLRDPRRMNVLLSRAEQQLILVGSLEFLKESTRFVSSPDDEELGFVLRFLTALEELKKEKSARGAPAATVVALNDLRVGAA